MDKFFFVIGCIFAGLIIIGVVCLFFWAFSFIILPAIWELLSFGIIASAYWFPYWIITKIFGKRYQWYILFWTLTLVSIGLALLCKYGLLQQVIIGLGKIMGMQKFWVGVK